MRHLTEALRTLKSDIFSEMRVMLPGTVERYDHTTQKASVLPSLRREYRDGEVQDMPVIEDVPVVWPRTGSASLTMPMRRGDGVMLVMSDRSLDRWKQRGGLVTPRDTRKHALPDCVAVPGLYSFADPSPQDNNDDTVLRQGAMEVRLDNRGRIQIGNQQEELLSLLEEMMELYTQAICVNGSSLSNAPQMESIRQRLQEIKGA